ncbi:MAG: GNAT family N-acetyltransferase [Gammaproteobacteria bacterium]|uniref:GNAT family N-acetyltransferase n=1 Tax=Shewanella septentrionalis TaxID=2952223 RepID=A0A9X2WR12_9GAMM|nr:MULTISPECIES: GNAT family N-acetyltransferase [Shewanella]MBU1393376.1 GNAT family N-acetyltransferase [Gammaproteobacteria bacterium]QYX66040.1 GNAT family N-acetyltransferase [Shewanella putrefaciens]AUD59729.1 GCN5 family acetyltransferase [Shewanella sp. Pdp11]MBU1478340.1 GNAT family N-acetyltransferase [Gammaproteobacteria bacterium]MBU2003414.1 GNAT family N-acetyltransferase [Gammaproteobacteria bacterium]
MDIKTIMPIKFELVETAPLFHELLNLRSAAGRPSIGVELADVQALFWVSIRLSDNAEMEHAGAGVAKSNLLATACVYGNKPGHLAIEDFIVLPEYQSYGLAKIMLERVMDFVDGHASSGTCISITAYGESERLCSEYGFQYAPCANLGPNLLKIVA